MKLSCLFMTCNYIIIIVVVIIIIIIIINIIDVEQTNRMFLLKPSNGCFQNDNFLKVTCLLYIFGPWISVQH